MVLLVKFAHLQAATDSLEEEDSSRTARSMCAVTCAGSAEGMKRKGAPKRTTTRRRRGHRAPLGNTSCAPSMLIGITVYGPATDSLPTPHLKGCSLPSLLRVPSGKINRWHPWLSNWRGRSRQVSRPGPLRWKAKALRKIFTRAPFHGLVKK